MTVSLLLLLALALVAAVNGGLGALRGASRIWLRHYAERARRRSQVVAGYLEGPEELFVGAGTLVAVAAFTTGALVADSGERGAWLLARVAIWALVVIIAGQLVPRAIGRRWPTRFVRLLAPLLQAVMDLTRPLRRAMAWLVSPLAAPAPAAATDEDDLADVLREAEQEGFSKRGDFALISGVVQFADRTVGEVMTPRADIFAVDLRRAPRENAVQIAQAAYSRVPVYDESLDRITGMVHAFDVLKGDPDTLPPVRPVGDATTTERCKTLLGRLLASRLHVAIVREPGGAVAGVVTLEDLIEELVGDIRDEHDDPAPRGTAGD